MWFRIYYVTFQEVLIGNFQDYNLKRFMTR